MHYCKKASLFFAFLLTCLLVSAANHHAIINHADLKAFGSQYLLNADLDISLGKTIEEAIDKGVPVEFVYEFKLLTARRFWFDRKVAEANTRITVSYHALSRQYLVMHEDRQTSHEILSEAMIELVQLYDWPVFDQTVLKEGDEYKAVLSMQLDQNALPQAIQVEALKAEGWYLASEVFEWVPTIEWPSQDVSQ